MRRLRGELSAGGGQQIAQYLPQSLAAEIRRFGDIRQIDDRQLRAFQRVIQPARRQRLAPLQRQIGDGVSYRAILIQACSP